MTQLNQLVNCSTQNVFVQIFCMAVFNEKPDCQMISLDSWAPYGQGFNTFQKGIDVDLALYQTNTKPLLKKN